MGSERQLKREDVSCLFVSVVTSCLEASKQFRHSVENVNKIPAKFSLDHQHEN